MLKAQPGRGALPLFEGLSAPADPVPAPAGAVLDVVRSKEVTAAAIAIAGGAADEEDVANLLGVLYLLALTRPSYTADHVWDLFYRTYPGRIAIAGPGRKLGSRMGQVFSEAAKRGWVVNTGDTEPSARPTAHRKPQRVWRSLRYFPAES